MTPVRQALLDRLTERGIVRLVYIPDDVHTGGNISDAQVREADALIAVGGGTGIADRLPGNEGSDFFLRQPHS